MAHMSTEAVKEWVGMEGWGDGVRAGADTIQVAGEEDNEELEGATLAFAYKADSEM